MTTARAWTLALLVCAQACQWKLTPPSRADAAADALDAVAIDVISTVDSQPDSSSRPSIPRCASPGPMPPLDRDPSSRLWHAASLVRPVTSNANGRGACAGDLDGDGVPELVVLRADGAAEVYDPATLCLRTTLDIRENARACVIDDLDGDARPELALALNLRWGAHTMPSVAVGHVEPSNEQGTRWQWREPMSWQLNETRNVRGIGTPLATIDLDNDGARELVVGGTVTNDAPRSDAFLRVWEFSEGPGCGDETRCPRGVYNETFDALDTQTLVVAQLDADPERELLVELGCNRGGLHRFDRAWTRPVELASIGQPSNGTLVDIDADGALDFFTATSPRCNGGVGPRSALRWLRRDGEAFRYYNEIANPAVPGYAQAFVVALDALYDPRPELFLCTRDGDEARSTRVRCDLYSVDRPFIDAEWSWSEPDAHPDVLSHVLVLDANGDGLTDVLVVSEARVHLLLQRNR